MGNAGLWASFESFIRTEAGIQGLLSHYFNIGRDFRIFRTIYYIIYIIYIGPIWYIARTTNMKNWSSNPIKVFSAKMDCSEDSQHSLLETLLATVYTLFLIQSYSGPEFGINRTWARGCSLLIPDKDNLTNSGDMEARRLVLFLLVRSLEVLPGLRPIL